MLVAAGIGTLKLLHGDIAASVDRWVDVLRVDPDNHYIHPVLSKILVVSPKQLRELSIGTFFYAALFLTEGTGLLLRRRWAEYFTTISTAALVPLEIYELAKHFSALKVVVLLINLAIVVYLIARLRGPRESTVN